MKTFSALVLAFCLVVSASAFTACGNGGALYDTVAGAIEKTLTASSYEASHTVEYVNCGAEVTVTPPAGIEDYYEMDWG